MAGEIVKPTEITYSHVINLSGETEAERVFTVDLHGHKIYRISNLDKFTHLRCLDISCNLLEKIEGLESNTLLCELILYSNKISRISGVTGLKNLVQLSLQMNSIKNLGRGLKGLTKLEVLRLDMNSITEVDVSTNLEGCNSLVNLNLANNAVESIHNLFRLHKLEKLDLSHNRLSNIQSLANCSSITELNLNDNNLSGIFEVPALKSIQLLTLSNNSISEVRASTPCKHLVELQANNNKIEFLPKHIKTMLPNLQRLELKKNKISDINKLCDAIKECGNLIILLLDNNLIDLSTTHTGEAIRTAAPNVSELTDSTLPYKEVHIEEIKIETTLKEMEHSMKNYEDMIEATIRDIQTKLDTDATPTSSLVRPTSRCHSRARINEALEFASKHFKS